MPYVTSIERMGIEKGLQQGRQEGLQRRAPETLRLTLRLFRPTTALAVWLPASFELANAGERVTAFMENRSNIQRTSGSKAGKPCSQVKPPSR